MKKMNRKVFLMALLSTLVGWLGCSSGNSKTATAKNSTAIPTIRELNVQETRALLNANRNTLLIDVRTNAEYDGPLGHVEGSILLPLQDIDKWSSKYEDYQNEEVVLICRSGARSMRAATVLKEKGFQKLVNVKGGMIAWNKANLAKAGDN